MGVKGANPTMQSKIHAYILTPPKLSCNVIPWYSWEIGSRTPTDTKSMDVQVPYIKWHRSRLTASPPHPWAPNQESKIQFSICGCLNLQMQNLRIRRTDCICILKHLRISGPAKFKFKPVLFKSKL